MSTTQPVGFTMWSLWNERRQSRRGCRARRSRGRASSRPARVASSRFARHHCAIHVSIPRKRKYRPARSRRNSVKRPVSIARSRHCGIPVATATSRMPRAPRACAHRAPSACHRIVSSLRWRISAGSLGSDDTSTCWSSRFSNRISARPRIAVGSAASFRSSCACALFRTVTACDADARTCSHGLP